MDNLLTLYMDNDRASTEYITVNSCGICTNETDGDAVVKRPDGRQDYLLLILVKGLLYVQSGEQQLTMYPGQMLLFHPHQPQFYSTQPGIPYETRWIHFSGIGCESLLSELDFSFCTPLHLKSIREAERITADMTGEYLRKKPRYETILAGQFLTLLGLLSRIVYAAEDGGRGTWEPRLEETRKEIFYYYDQPLKIDDLAKLSGLSKSRYLFLFKKQYGVSPYNYQIMLRIDNAKTLLQSSDLSIRQIAERVGYSDQNYFSRLFMQRTGYTPTAYRKA